MIQSGIQAENIAVILPGNEGNFRRIILRRFWGLFPNKSLIFRLNWGQKVFGTFPDYYTLNGLNPVSRIFNPKGRLSFQRATRLIDQVWET